MQKADDARLQAGHLLSVDIARRPRVWRWVDAAFDIVYPPRCAGCQRLDEALCETCRDQALHFSDDQMPSLRDVGSPLSGAAATGLHDHLLRDLVVSLKEYASAQVVRVLAARMAIVLQELAWPVTLIAPVPLHAARLRERGYNQSDLLARNLGAMTGIAVRPQALQRVRNTPHQVGLSAEARQANVEAAFHASRPLVANHRLLLVDDVLTTGATLIACAEAAALSGAEAVFGLTVTSARLPT